MVKHLDHAAHKMALRRVELQSTLAENVKDTGKAFEMRSECGGEDKDVVEVT